jgi:hypothetical protein
MTWREIIHECDEGPDLEVRRRNIVALRAWIAGRKDTTFFLRTVERGE